MPSTVSDRADAPSPAPGVTRLGDPEVSFYLLEAPDGLVLVGGGLPGHLPQLTDVPGRPRVVMLPGHTPAASVTTSPTAGSRPPGTPW